MGETSDFSKAFEQLQQMLSSSDGQSQIQSILSSLTSGQQDSTNSPCQEESYAPAEMPDMDTIMKIAEITKMMNSNRNNTHTAFLNALRPFLKESRRKKLDQASNILKISSVLKILKQNPLGGD